MKLSFFRPRGAMLLVAAGATLGLGMRPALAAPRQQLGSVDSLGIYRAEGDNKAFFFRSGLTIDADGAPRAYHRDSSLALDNLGNAGRPGDWWALMTDTGDKTGTPLLQKATDPAPGFYISMTTLEDNSKDETDTRRYVDSTIIPYMVLPGHNRFGAKVGDYAVVIETESGLACGAVFADHGPPDHLGEGSIALAQALGIDPDPKEGGTDAGVVTIVFPGSGQGWPKTADQVKSRAMALYADWGGWKRLKGLLP